MGILDFARKNVVKVSPEDDIYTVANKMYETRVGSVVVIEDNSPVGIITDRDIVMDVVGQQGDPSNTLAKELMTKDPFIVDKNKGIFDVIQGMKKAGVRRVPIIDERTNILEGIITLDDLISLLTTELKNLSNIIEEESPPPED